MQSRQSHQEQIKLEVYECEECLERFQTQEGLLMHIANQHETRMVVNEDNFRTKQEDQSTEIRAVGLHNGEDDTDIGHDDVDLVEQGADIQIVIPQTDGLNDVSSDSSEDDMNIDEESEYSETGKYKF